MAFGAAVLPALLWPVLGTAGSSLDASEDPLPPTGVGAVEPAPAGRSGLALNVGWASPVGELGLTYWHELLPALRFEVGSGLGLSGIQVSGMGRLTLPARSYPSTSASPRRSAKATGSSPTREPPSAPSPSSRKPGSRSASSS